MAYREYCVPGDITVASALRPNAVVPGVDVVLMQGYSIYIAHSKISITWLWKPKL